MILIGSRALKFLYNDIGREPDDWDFIISEEELDRLSNDFKIDRIRSDKAVCKEYKAEFYVVNPDRINSDWFILDQYNNAYNSTITETPFGQSFVAHGGLLLAIKEATYDHIKKTKHARDIDFLKNLSSYFKYSTVHFIRKLRSQEIKDRLGNEKDKFFNNYNIQRIFNHDELHTYVAEKPAYTMFLTKDSAVELDQERFKKAPLNVQVRMAREEALVLAMERWLIPMINNHPMQVAETIKTFLDTSKSSSPIRTMIDKLCNREGQSLKDHPHWLADEYAQIYGKLFDGLDEYLKEKVDNFPKEFWVRALKTDNLGY